MLDYILPITFIRGYKPFLLFLLSSLAVVSGISTIISKNPVFAVLCLIGLFANIALYFITLGLDFIGLSYLLVYIGAISILFIIVLMLINIRISELLENNRNSVFLAIFTLLCFNYLTSRELPYADEINNFVNVDLNQTDRFIKYISSTNRLELYSAIQTKIEISNCYSPAWDTVLVACYHIIAIGNTLYTVFSPLFILLSLILLLAMIGAILVTTNKSSKKIFDLTLYDNK